MDALGSLSQAVILAGGEGTRLRPLTYRRAKPVVPLLNQPFLAYQLALLRAHGVTDVILACSYRVDDVRAALGHGEALGTRLRYVIEQEPLGTGGGVRNAADLAAGTVFVLNGDVLSDADLGAMRRAHRACGARVTIYVTPVEDPRAYGLVETAADGRVLRFREKPGPDEPITTNVINAGIYLIDAELLGRMPSGRPVSIEREFFPALLADDVPVYAWSGGTYWRDIGNPGAYLAAQLDLLENRVGTALRPAGRQDDGLFIGAGATLAPDARAIGPSVLGSDVTLAAGSQVGPLTVLGDGVAVEAGARVARSVVWERTVIGPGADLAGVIVGADARIGAGARLGPGTVVESGGVVPPRSSAPARA